MPSLPAKKAAAVISAAFRRILVTGLIWAAAYTAVTQTPAPEADPGVLKKLSLEELMKLEVTSVSKRTENFFVAPAAPQMITRPGGTLWSANAVTGVINLTTKNVQDPVGGICEAFPSSRAFQRGQGVSGPASSRGGAGRPGPNGIPGTTHGQIGWHL